MLKRELGVAASDVVLDGPRAKRSRNVSGESGGSGVSAVKDKDGDGDVEMKDDVVVGGGGDDNGGSGMTKEDVREKGVEVWQIVKGAVNKENRTLSTDFLRLPSKRQYPDYYTLIKRPIALEDIHANLDKLKYPTLEALRTDFEVCFKNAKKYNVRESQIWRDAKTLQKIATKEIDKILHPNEDEHVDVDGSDDDGDGTSKKKKKLPNMTRLMKSRLQKLVGRKDDDGRQLSNVFMDLPSKKKWPLYYKTIKRPICIEDIFKRIKRKEYETVADFMAEVELVFANALQFNDDHSPIWEDAVLLRDYFRKLMQDLPPPFTLHGTQADVAAYLSASASSPDAGGSKIMLKLPHQQQQLGASGSGEVGKAGVTLRVPATPAGGAGGHVNGAATPVVNGIAKSTAGGAAATTATKQTGGGTTKGTAKQHQQQHQQQYPQTFAPQQQQQQQHAASVTPGGYYNTGHYTPHSYYPSQTGSGSTAAGSTSARTSSIYPHTPSTLHLSATTNLAYSTSTSTNATTNALQSATTTTAANSYAHNSLSLTPPVTEKARTLRSARLRVRLGEGSEEVGRCVLLSEKEGVRSWVVRLVRGESGVLVDKVVGYLGDHDGEDEPAGKKRKAAMDDEGSEEEEEEEEEESEEEVVVRRGRKGKAKAGTATRAAGRSVSPAKGGKGKKVERVKTRRAARDEKAGAPGGAGEGEDEEGGGEVYVKMDGVVVEHVGVGVGVDKDKDKEKDVEGDRENGKDVDMDADTENAKEDENEEKEKEKRDMEKWSIDVPIGSHILELGQKGGAPWRVYLERRV